MIFVDYGFFSVSIAVKLVRLFKLLEILVN